MRNTTIISVAIKSLFLALAVVLLTFSVFSVSHAKVVKKRDVPVWFTTKNEVYFSDVPLKQLLSFVLPPSVKLEMDSIASEIKVSVKGKFSIEEILNQYRNLVEYSVSNSSLSVYGYVVRKYEISYLPSQYSSVQQYSSATAIGNLSGQQGSATTTTQGQGGQGAVSVEYRTSINFWDEIKQEIKDLLQATEVSEVSQQPVTQAPPDSATYMKPQVPQQVYHGGGPKSFVTINKAAGLVVVGGTVDKVKKVDAYMEYIRDKLNESIEVDFTLIEVRNKKSTNTGISWQAVLRRLIHDKPYSLTISTSNLGIKSQSSFDINLTGAFYGTDQQQLILSVLKEVADVRVITKTNFMLKNNTTVGFHTGTLTTYIDSLQSSSSGESVSYTVVKGAVLNGIEIAISASIDKDNITLSLIPTLSNLVNMEKITFGNNLVVQNPQIEAKKSVATVTVKSGETAAIVGYNASNQSFQREGMPLLGDIPVIGLLFSRSVSVNDDASVVMLLTPRKITPKSKDKEDL